MAADITDDLTTTGSVAFVITRGAYGSGPGRVNFKIARANRFPVQTPFDLRYLDELLGRAMPPAAIALIVTELGLEPE